jgi:Holliday junction resolvase RusA-like endonuclease
MLKFNVVGTPVAQPRPRRGSGNHMYNPPDADHWKGQVKFATTRAVKDAIPSGGPHEKIAPFFLQLVFRLPRPADHYKRGGVLRDTMISVRFSRGKQDADNLAKGVMDGMSQAIASPWSDDNQVVLLIVVKLWTSRDPGVDVSLVDLTGREDAAVQTLLDLPELFDKAGVFF